MWRRITLVARRPCQGLIGHWHGVRWYSRGGKEKQQQRQLKEKNLKTGKSVEDLKEDYQEVMYSRRHKERTDSLSLEMLEDRVRHKKRYEILSKPTPLVREMARLGHGKKTRMKNIYESLEPTEDSWMSKTAPRTATGAGGLATLIGTATKKWPLFKHMLPEIAFAGHSNCGKVSIPSIIF